VVTVQTKEGLEPAWVHVPGDPAAPERARQFVDEAADVKGKASRRTAL
jgi:hypothetical protein